MANLTPVHGEVASECFYKQKGFICSSAFLLGLYVVFLNGTCLFFKIWKVHKNKRRTKNY